MAGRVRGRALNDAPADAPHRARAWLALAAVLAAGAIVVTLAPGGAAPDTPATARPWSATLDWQPGLGLAQPWRAWTAAFVHGSRAHLAGNLLATLLVAWLGLRARMGARDALAWGIAWPLTQAGLALVASASPEAYAAQLPHYFGLSGVLHAGVVVVALSLCVPAHATRERVVGAALLAGTLAKVLSESPWDLAPRPGGWLDVAVAPVAHASGALAGALAWAALAAGAALARRATSPRT